MIQINTVSLNDTSLLQINKNEALRYLGVKKEDEVTGALFNECERDLRRLSQPKAVYIKTDIAVNDDEIDFGFMKVNSTKLAKNLKECGEAYIFAATLGIGLDRHFQRLSAVSQSRAMVFSALASALVESFCDYVNEEIVKGKEARPRFSCGYGDFCLEHQGDILNALEANKRLGICLTDSCMMIPVKSVTAVIGIRR